MTDISQLDRIRIEGNEIVYTLKRSKRKTLAIRVDTDATVSVRAPLKTSLAYIRDTVIKSSSWIIWQQIYFSKQPKRKSEKEYIEGEIYDYLGKKYPLKFLIHHRPSITIHEESLLINVKDKNNRKQIGLLIDKWYRKEAYQSFLQVLKEWWQRFPKAHDPQPKLLIRSMKRRWGSYYSSGKIILNLKLIETPIACIEYVIVHEICHAFHKNHNKHFYTLMASHLPDWKSRKQQLESYLWV